MTASPPRSAPPIVLLGGEGRSTRIVYHALARQFDNVTAIIEPRTSQWELFKRRRRKLGTTNVLGQALFVVLLLPLLTRLGRARVAEVMREHGLRDDPIPDALPVSTVNGDETRARLVALAPRVVVVNGTRIIGRATLQCVDAPFVNMHAGITPAYRGVHGGYWALADARPDLVGTTIHYVDEGIDTGSIIQQRHFDVTARDNFSTYPLLHTAVGIPLLVDAVAEIQGGRLPARQSRPDLPSRLRTHPTLWRYLWRRIRAGVR